MKLTTEFANKVYDILVKFGNALEDERDDFIYHHTETNICTEWRFRGKFGFGGKYRSTWNGVTAYSESITPDMKKDLDIINLELKKI